MKFKIWCDSGANIHSCRQEDIDIDISEEDLAAMSEDEQEEMFKEYAFEKTRLGLGTNRLTTGIPAP